MSLIKKLSIIMCVVLSIQVYAQEEDFKKSTYLGGSFSFDIVNKEKPHEGGWGFPRVEKYKSTYFSINPKLINDINDNWQMGLIGQFNFFKSQEEKSSWNDNLFNTKELGAGGGVFFRYIFNPQNKLNFYLAPKLNFSYNERKTYYDGDSEKESSSRYFAIGVGAGLRYMVSKKWCMTLSMGGLNYINGSEKVEYLEERAKINKFQSNFNLASLSFGFEYKL